MLKSSLFAYTEVGSAMLAKERSAAIPPEHRRRGWTAFQHNVDEELIELVAYSPAIFKRANRILEQCHPHVPLRSRDAVHQASCDQLQNWPPCSTDKRMRAVAERLYFPLTPLSS